MTRLNIHGRNIDLTSAIKEAIFEKVERVFTHFDFIQTVDIHLGVHKNPRIAEAHVVEALIHVNRGLIKVEAHSEDLYASMDILIDKMMRSLNKYKAKNLSRSKSARSHKGESIRLHSDTNGTTLEPVMEEPLFEIELEMDELDEAKAFAEAEVQTKKYA